MTTKTIAVIVGSLRKESFNRKMALNLIRLAPPQLKLEILEIGHLQMYNQDFDENPPSEWIDFRLRVKSFDGVLFVTPEYNRSMPAVLKNAIDVASRPYGQNVWSGKPGAVISVSPGVIGGFGANHHLRQCCVFLNVLMMQQPEAYINGATKLFEENGNIVETSREFVSKFIHAYADWVFLISGGPRQT
jgi:chromate reductase